MKLPSISRAAAGCIALGSLLAYAPRPLSAAPAQLLADGVLVGAHSSASGVRAPAPVFFHHPRLEHMVEELERLSPTAARMLDAIRAAGFPLAIGSFHDLAEEMRKEHGSWDPSRRRTVGYMAPVVRSPRGARGELITVKILVALNLDRLDDLFSEGRRTVPEGVVSWGEIERLETLAILAHELVHAYGLAVAGGDPHLGCPDPTEAEVPETSCVVVGENLVRHEIGAPLDWGYGLPGLPTLAARYDAIGTRKEQLRRIALSPLFRLPEPVLFAQDR